MILNFKMVKEGEWDEKRKMNATIPLVVWVYVEWNIDFFFGFNSIKSSQFQNV